MNVVMPARGEFGLKLRYHVPVVHALPGPKVVYCEPGEEALYPSADEIHYVESPPDDNRRGLLARDVPTVDVHVPKGANLVRTKQGMPEAWFTPQPTVWQGAQGLVVVCPRFRMYGASKNWDAWPSVSEKLCAAGVYTFAAGLEESSYGVIAHEHAWGYDRPLDATIEAMSEAALVIATSSGLAVLAIMCGAPLLLVTHQGLIAPGPQVDALGNVLQHSYGNAPIKRLLKPVNHLGAPIMPIDGWDNPDAVVRTALEWLE